MSATAAVIPPERRFQPAAHLATRGSDPAVVMATAGTVISFDEVERASRRLGRALLAAGLGPGSVVAVLLENHPAYFEVMLACQRLGVYSVPVNWHLQADEVEYIVTDCGADMLVTSARLAGLVSTLTIPDGVCPLRLMMDAAGSAPAGFSSYEDFVDGHDDGPLGDGVELEGSFMFYSSGTTGRPKGIKRPMSTLPFGAGPMSTVPMLEGYYGVTPESVYLCPAPLYHAAPLVWSTGVQRLGATVIVMERFDPLDVLRLIEEHGVTHAQFVPTHFVRMLKLSDAERSRFDLSSLRVAVHAAAPCPVDVKQRMMDWWGPIIHEYYAGSEATGACLIGPEDWLAHPGSVGRPLTGAVHITDDEGIELPPGEAGRVWFETDMVFEYHNDPVKTAGAFNDRGWNTLGDIGYLDEDGYLFLTDRASHMIISGGVNIYPQEVESALTLHPWVSDIAVIGVPNEDLGEEVKAVVVTTADAPADPAEVERGLIAYARERIAHYKCPVSVDVVDDLPRLPTGKLLKRQLRDRYWPAD
ncbi:MAG: hypothetical protein RIR49_285 [Actinomycetota bacterium]